MPQSYDAFLLAYFVKSSRFASLDRECKSRFSSPNPAAIFYAVKTNNEDLV